ncbi:hypothetical protein [Sabulicella glaciei]|uniref:Uncharacterized protein n=1 Tax=Sabulicella glaciei TaxID=2984948 RepID=A0ABT3P1M9_9PROT|nr:hypothetical protein [Roseococcus sp. MDT2-1-1]MCW8088296.1 hypothetical protein [Roseococcus sp. MDT2-1-1]
MTDNRLGVALALCAAAMAMVAVRHTPESAPAAAVPALNASYGGTLAAAFEGREGECSGHAAAPLLVVSGRRVSFRAGPAVLRGIVHAGGLTVLSGALDGPATLTGRFEADGRFLGELRSWTCIYAVDLMTPS